MSHLAQFLASVLEEEQIDAKTLAKRMGVDPAVLSRLATGRRRTCNETTLRRIVQGCSKHRLRQAHCLAAYLSDQLYAPFDRLITVRCE